MVPVFLSEKDKVVHTKLLLENVKPASINKVPVILAKISNQTPTVFGKLKITSEVLDSDGNTVISKSSNTICRWPLIQILIMLLAQMIKVSRLGNIS